MALPALACAVSYPVAILALLATIVALKPLFGIDPVREAVNFAQVRTRHSPPLLRQTIVVDHPELAGFSLEDLYRRTGEQVIVSRIRPAGEQRVKTANFGTIAQLGYALLAVCKFDADVRPHRRPTERRRLDAGPRRRLGGTGIYSGVPQVQEVGDFTRFIAWKHPPTL